MTTEHIPGLEPEPKTALGFGGKTIERQLEIGDVLYLLMRCEVVSDGRSKKDDDGLAFKAGAKTEIVAEYDEETVKEIVDRYAAFSYAPFAGEEE
ncbi:MAG TPA: hypothetical protein VF377_06800 [Acidimicrobiia bacterium]